MSITVRSFFSQWARKASRAMGHPFALVASIVLVLLWAVTGPHFQYSDTWQLVINTGTSIVTFLMVFLIQNSQNRDTDAIQIKLNEIIRAIEGAHNAVVALEELNDEELSLLRERYARLAETARQRLQRGKGDTGAPHVAVEDCAADAMPGDSTPR